MSRRNDGGRAFPWCGDFNDCPTINLGMTLRDHFATVVDKDEYGDILYRHMSRDMEEALAGPAPVEPPAGSSREDRTAYGLSMLNWHIQVRAAIRYRMADAMLAERDKDGAQ